MPHLGELERRIMEVLWRPGSPARSVRGVLGELSGRDLAYTTVLTVLDRLAKKGLVDRVRDGRAWRYTAAVSRERLAESDVRQILADPLLDRAAVAAALSDVLPPPGGVSSTPFAASGRTD